MSSKVILAGQEPGNRPGWACDQVLHVSSSYPKLTVGIMALVAQQEREAISARDLTPNFHPVATRDRRVLSPSSAVNGGPTVRKSGGVIFLTPLRSPPPEPRGGSGGGERCRSGTEPVM